MEINIRSVNTLKSRRQTKVGITIIISELSVNPNALMVFPETWSESQSTSERRGNVQY